MDKYFVLEVVIPEAISDKLDKLTEVAIEKYNCQGSEEFSMNEPSVDELLGERSYSGGDVPDEVIAEVAQHMGNRKEQSIKFYFSDNSAQQDVDNFKNYLLKQISNLKYKIKEEQTQDWNKEWRKHYHTIEISEQMKVIPSWETVPDIKYPIIIYPGQGFGTGTHETTYLCLKLLDKYIKHFSFDSCMDYGCGSAILGVAAKKRGFSKVDLYDIDENAIENSKQNLDLNFENADGFNLYLPKDVNKFKNYDLVFANILANVLISESSHITATVRNNGFLILSGILEEHCESVVAQYQRKNFKLIEKLQKNEWVALLMERYES